MYYLTRTPRWSYRRGNHVKAFKGLFIKEVKVTKNWFLLGLALIFFMFLLGVGLESYFKEHEILAIMFIFIFVMHGFYMPIYLLLSLNIEGQTQSWLHNPNSGSKLFIAKMATGFVFFLASIFITMLITGWGINHAMSHGSILIWNSGIFLNLTLLAGGLILGSIYIGIWVLFYWSFFHSINSVPTIKSFRWPIVIGFWLLMNMGSNFIQNQPFYQKLEKMSVIELHSIPSFDMKSGDFSFFTGPFETAEISLLSGVVCIVVAIVIFIIAVWLLERKVEV